MKRETDNIKDLSHDLTGHPGKSLSITSEQRGAVSVLRFSGDLDLKSLPRAKAALAELLAEGVPSTSAEDARKALPGRKAGASTAGPLQLVIDLEKVEYIDSSGLGFFIGSLKRIKEQKGDMKLARLNAYMMGIFRLINMHYIIEVYDDLDKAVNSLATPRSALSASTADGKSKE